MSRILCVFISISSFLPLFLSNLPANLADKTDYTPILLCKQDIFCLFPCQLLYFHVEYSFRTLLKFTIQEEFLWLSYGADDSQKKPTNWFTILMRPSILIRSFTNRIWKEASLIALLIPVIQSMLSLPVQGHYRAKKFFIPDFLCSLVSGYYSFFSAFSPEVSLCQCRSQDRRRRRPHLWAR